ncbi:MAG: Do family serine endopeptidase [Hyphomicrobiaceae bacterium]
MSERNIQAPPSFAVRTRSPLVRKLLIGASALALLAGAGQLHSDAPRLAHADTVATAQTGAPGFADLVARVKPAVVSVQVKMKGGGNVAMSENGTDPFNGQNPFEGSPFGEFFKKFGGPNFKFEHRGGKKGNEGSAPFAQALGSGFLISADGYAVTNNHVVDGAVEVKVVTDDGRTLDAKVIGTDSKTDLALIKVDASGLPYVRLAASKPRIGDWVVAMGNPFGLGGTVTAGIVSAEGRDIGSGPYDDFIQIDAPVNKGNSGGPTFNLDGEVIGVNTAIFSPSGGSVGIAFDIPSPTVSSVVAELQKSGRVDRAWLGVEIQPVTADIADSLGLSNAKGALVARLEDDSPASKVGLKAGDVIVKVDGKEVEDARDLARRIGSLHPGSKVEIDYVRDGKERQIALSLGELKDKTASAEPAAPQTDNSSTLDNLGIAVAPAASVDGAGDHGVVITEIDGSGAAASAGLAQGDVIVSIAGQDVASANDIDAALSKSKKAGKSRALALVRHGEEQRFVPLPVAAG